MSNWSKGLTTPAGPAEWPAGYGSRFGAALGRAAGGAGSVGSSSGLLILARCSRLTCRYLLVVERLVWPSRRLSTNSGRPASIQCVAKEWRLCRARHKRQNAECPKMPSRAVGSH